MSDYRIVDLVTSDQIMIIYIADKRQMCVSFDSQTEGIVCHAWTSADRQQILLVHLIITVLHNSGMSYLVILTYLQNFTIVISAVMVKNFQIVLLMTTLEL